MLSAIDVVNEKNLFMDKIVCSVHNQVRVRYSWKL